MAATIGNAHVGQTRDSGEERVISSPSTSKMVDIGSPVFQQGTKSKLEWYQLASEDHCSPKDNGARSASAKKGVDNIVSLEESFAQLLSPKPTKEYSRASAKTLKEPSSSSTLFEASHPNQLTAKDAYSLLDEENPFLLSGSSSEEFASKRAVRVPTPTASAQSVERVELQRNSPANSPLKFFPGLSDEKPQNLFAGTDRKSFTQTLPGDVELNEDSPKPVALKLTNKEDWKNPEPTLGDTLKREKKLRKALTRRLQEEVKENKNLRLIIDNYEETLDKVIAAVAEEKQKAEAQATALIKERAELEKKVDLVESLFKDMRLRYENTVSSNAKFLKNEQSLQENIGELKQEVLLAQERLEKVVKHAEEQLQSANMEIIKIKNESDKEQSMLKAKLARGELKMQSLEKTLLAKEEEYGKLTNLCDDLVSQLENRSS